MQYIASVIILLTAIGLFVCGSTLWRHKDETKDRARIILSLIGYAAALFTLILAIRKWNGITTDEILLLSPEGLFFSAFFQLMLYLYHLELMKTRWNQNKVYVFLFIPLLLVIIIGLGGIFGYTEINSFKSLLEHIHEPDVLFRMLILALMFLYGPILLLIPYDYEKSKAGKGFVVAFSCSIFLMNLLHSAVQFTHNHVPIITQQCTWTILFFLVTRYELKTREQKMFLKEQERKKKEALDHDPLWGQILHAIEIDQEWRNPDLKLSTLSTLVGSNRTYVADAFKRNTGMGFSEYISKRRINYVTSKLATDPSADVHEIFFSAGFRSPSTAWENFQRVTGMTVSEFLSKKLG